MEQKGETHLEEERKGRQAEGNCGVGQKWQVKRRKTPEKNEK